MSQAFHERLHEAILGFRRDGVYKRLNHIDSPQAAVVRMEGRGDVVVLSSNNYLGLCNRPEVVEAGRAALDRFGAGTGSVRFICGTFTVHRELEEALATFVGTPAALSYVSCWNANEGLMPTVLDDEDVVISDALNHASIIDSVRLCKATRRVYAHSDMGELERILQESRSARTRFVIIGRRVQHGGRHRPAPRDHRPGSTLRCRRRDRRLARDGSPRRDRAAARRSTSVSWGRWT